MEINKHCYHQSQCLTFPSLLLISVLSLFFLDFDVRSVSSRRKHDSTRNIEIAFILQLYETAFKLSVPLLFSRNGSCPRRIVINCICIIHSIPNETRLHLDPIVLIAVLCVILVIGHLPKKSPSQPSTTSVSI